MRKCLRENYIGKRIDLCDVKIRISSLIDESEGNKFLIYPVIKDFKYFQFTSLRLDV